MSVNGFYTVVLSASATLMGLLFLAVLFNADRRGHRLGAGWLAVARSTLNIYIVLILLPLVLLFPDFDDRVRAGLIIVLGVFSTVRQFICWRTTVRIDASPMHTETRRLIWLFLAPAAAFALVTCSATAALVWRVPFYNSSVSISVLALFTIALRNSWNLILQHSGLTGESRGGAA